MIVGSGFICFREKLTLFKLKRTFGDKCSFRVMRGSLAQNEVYCSKEGQYESIGVLPQQGIRNDIRQAFQLIRDKKSELDVFEEHPGLMLRCNYGMRHYRRLIEQRQRRAIRIVTVEVFWGPTGTGKSHTAYHRQPNLFKIQGHALRANDCQGWWDGYLGETTLLIDEYHNDVPIGVLESLLDKYPLPLPTKGSFTYANWTQVFITTNMEPEEWHTKATQLQQDALRRRINTMTNMSVVYCPQ